MSLREKDKKILMEKLKIPENSPLYVLKNDCSDVKLEKGENIVHVALENELINKEDSKLLNSFLKDEKMDSKQIEQLVTLHNKLNMPGIGSLFEFEGGIPEEEFLNIYTLYTMGKYPKSFSNYNRLAKSLALFKNDNLHKWLCECEVYIDRLKHVLHWVCEKGHTESAEWIHKSISELKIQEIDLDNAFTCACEKGNLDMIEWLLKRAKITDSGKQRGYMLACQYDNVEVVKLLFRHNRSMCNLKNGFDKAWDYDGINVVKWIYTNNYYGRGLFESWFEDSCKKGNIKIVKWGLTMLKYIDIQKWIDIAQKSNQNKVVDFLLKVSPGFYEGKKEEKVDIKPSSPLGRAAIGNYSGNSFQNNNSIAIGDSIGNSFQNNNSMQ